MTGPFDTAEYRARVHAAQGEMQAEGIAALLLTTEPELRYFTGFLTRFWESPTRPWFLVLPAAGDPIAVIPSIGAALMQQTWITDIRTWRAPDPADDGVTLLAGTLKEAARGGDIGTPMGLESHLRMPLENLARLQALLGRDLRDDADIVRRLRMVKSEAEIAAITTACAIAGRAFARVPEIARTGAPLDRVFRDFQRLCLEEGADWVPYLAGAAAAGGYADVISPATTKPLERGDVLMLDTGLVRHGYFCDYNRNFSLGPPDADTRSAHARLIDATHAALDIARPGATAADLFRAMDAVLTGGQGRGDAGRLGHGLGMQLTEGLSLIPQDHTVLQPGMVLTLEPGCEVAPGRMLVHEEDIVIRDGPAELLSPISGPEMGVLE